MDKQTLVKFKITLYHKVAALREQVNKLDPSATTIVKLELNQIEALIEWLDDQIKESRYYER